VGEFLGSRDIPSSPDAAIAGEQLTEAHVAAVQAMLKAEFVAAERRWPQWKPVFYPTEERRPDNPRKLAKKTAGKGSPHPHP
jgi:hypothetical protein